LTRKRNYEGTLAKIFQNNEIYTIYETLQFHKVMQQHL